MRIFLPTLLALASVSLALAQINKPQAPSLGAERQAQQQQVKQHNAGTLQKNAPTTRQAELAEARTELSQNNRSNAVVHYEFSKNTDPAALPFQQSLTDLQQMLDGKQDLSLKRAVFLSEQAVVGNSLTYDRFCSSIDMEMDILRQFMQRDSMDENSDIAKKFMLQQFFSDTLIMRDARGRYQFTHYPYRYDFEDPFAEKDWRPMLVSKLLATKKGQCHSMPLLYLIFAEALGVKAWLAFSPEHSYIKTQDERGRWYNFETTNGHYASDTWMLSSGYVKPEALRYKIFMDTLSKKETVAACLVDLGKAYSLRFGFDPFVLTCAEKALQHSPRNIFALQLQSDYYTYLFHYVARQLGSPPLEQLLKNPKMHQMELKIRGFHQHIKKMGYEDMPEALYKAWLKSFERAQAQQPAAVIRP